MDLCLTDETVAEEGDRLMTREMIKCAVRVTRRAGSAGAEWEAAVGWGGFPEIRVGASRSELGR